MRLHSSQSGLSRTALLTLLALTSLGGGGWYWSQRNAGEVSFQTSAITRGKITQSVTATGTINPVINVQVGSQISGIIEKLNADFNSPVKAGQVVAQIDPATYQAAVMQAEGELANAQAALELARLNEKRARELDARKAAPQANLDQAVASLHQAEAQVKIKSGSLARAKVDLERCTIYSPVDGIVLSRSVDVGQTVAASLSAPIIFTIANDLSKMQINANVAEADVGKVGEGQNVNFTVDAFPARTFHGKVIQVRNAATTVSNVVSYDVVIEVNNHDLKLKPGMTATASIIVDSREDAIRISASALRFRLPDNLLPKEQGSAAAENTNSKPLASGDGQGQGQGQTNRGEGGGKNAEGRPDRPWRADGGGRRSREGRGGNGGSGSGGDESQVQTRTVYLLRDGKPTATRIKTGITDGLNTEVLEGLKDGDLAIAAILGSSAQSSGPSAAPNSAANPFMPTPRGPGGGGPRPR